MNHSWMSAIIRSENSVEKMQVFWPWSSLRMSAWTVPRTLASVHAASSARSTSVGSRPCLGGERVDPGVNGRVQEEREDCRRRAVDRHRHRGARCGEVEPGVERLHVVQGGDRDAGRADLAVHVRRRVRVAAVQRHRVERGRQPGRRRPWASSLNRRLVRNASPSPANIRAGSSPSRLNGKTPAVNGKPPGRFSLRRNRSSVAGVVEPRQRHPGNPVAGQRLPPQLRVQFLVPHPNHQLIGAILGYGRGPLGEQLNVVPVHPPRRLRNQRVQSRQMEISCAAKESAACRWTAATCESVAA